MRWCSCGGVWEASAAGRSIAAAGCGLGNTRLGRPLSRPFNRRSTWRCHRRRGWYWTIFRGCLTWGWAVGVSAVTDVAGGTSCWGGRFVGVAVGAGCVVGDRGTAGAGFQARPQGGGTAPADDRAVFTAIVFVLTSGCAWRYLPPSFGVTVPTAHRAVLDRLGGSGDLDWSSAILDAASVRAKKGDL